MTCELSSLENMAQNSPTGPIRLAKPTGVIKLKVKKKKKTTQSTSIRSSNALKPINGPIQDGGRVHALKRKNPFRCSPRKKTNLTSDAKTSECRLFNVLDGLDEDIENVSTNTVNSTAENTSQNTFDPHVVDSEQTEVEIPIDEIEGLQTFPLDWSLKSKIRFTSSKSFNWCGTLKTLHEGEGLSKFVRCQPKEAEINFDPTDESLENSINGLYPSSFCSFTKVWMHPSLPWLEMFPRRSVDGRSSSKRDIRITDEMASCLHRDWVSSFRSVFNLVRVGFCPYFYLVANQNTMLFQAAGINREDTVQVLITPTTKGFREALRNEGKINI